MNRKFLFVALFLAALTFGFIACDNDDLRLDNDDDNIENVTDIDSDSINSGEGEEDYYSCDSTEMICTGKAYDITTTTAKVAATIHIPLTLLAQCQLGVQVSSSKEDLMAHENVTNFTTKDLTGNNFVVNLENLESGATTYYYCAYIYLNGIYHYGLIREFKTWCVLTTRLGFYTYSGEPYYGNTDCEVDGAGDYAPGSKVTLSAISGVDWYFDFWSDCDSKELNCTITITSDTTITANFKRKPYLTAKPNYTPGGTVTGSGCYEVGAEATITAMPKRGFYFERWSDGNTDNPRTVTVTKDITYTAIFNANPNGMEQGYEWVDLGLSVKWATCNVGATAPEGYGDYFAWGEIEPKTTYDWSTYKYGSDYDELTKYCTDSDYGKDGFADYKTILDPEDDAAAVNWGGAWRMPTEAEWEELRTKCTWTWTTHNGMKGYMVKSNINGNSIFLPAAGYRYDVDLRNSGYYGFYWSSSLNTVRPGYAWFVDFYSGLVGRLSYDRYFGRSVRPVLFGE
ncbi:MAG: hypothetical protein ACI30B_06915 [Paludibacteraceae bacterium]